jgi:aflatoxin B1 aldehyde reductase
MKLILGTMNIEYPWTSNQNKSIDEYKNIIDYYIDHCIESSEVPILDTAYYYGNCKTEQVLGQIIPNLKIKPIIATKANPWLNNDFTNGKFGQLSKNNLSRQLDTSLTNLGLDSVDVFYLHCWDWNTSIEETLEITNDLWRKEKFNKFGISNFSLKQINQVIDIIDNNDYCQLSYYQGMYNMIARNVEEIFSTLNDNNIEFWAYNPLAGGLLTGKYKNVNNNNIEENCRFKSNEIYQNIFWKEPIVQGINDFINIQNCTSYALNWYSLDSKLSKSNGLINFNIFSHASS